VAFSKVFLTATAVFIFLEGLIFRTGFYPSFVEPTSSTGSFETKLRLEQTRRSFGPDEILVTGDSRMAEGFSPKIANAACTEHGYYFANVAIPGATPRCLFYLLRDLDPSRSRYRAIILPVERYDDIDEFEDLADRLLDLHYCIVRLRYGDSFQFAASFSTSRRRMEAFRGSLFKGLVFQSDLLAFLEQPQKRLSEVVAWREHGREWMNDYTGRAEDLDGIQVNWVEKKIRFPERVSPSIREDIFFKLLGPIPPQTGKLAQFRRLWFGRILGLYRNSGTKLIFLALPRGPIVPPIPRVQTRRHSVRDLDRTPGVILLPDNLFASLEDGKLYFDSMHMNARGRVQFSMMLAHTIRSIWGPSHN
jgi:hypothetical protein